MATKASSQISIVDISDAYSVTLTSDSYTFIGNTTGAPSGLSCSTQVVSYCGAELKKSNISKVTCPTGISVTLTNNNTTSPTITFKTTATVTAACQATIDVSVDDVTIQKTFSFSVAKTGSTGAKGDKGDTGTAGKGVKSTSVTYQTWKDGTTTPTGTWSSTPPKTTASAPYLWTRTIITYTDNTTSTSYSVGATPEGIQVGGRNLITNSNFSKGITGWVADGTKVDFFKSSTGNYSRVIAVCGNKRIYQSNKFKQGQTYSVSYKACIDSSIVLLATALKAIPPSITDVTMNSNTDISFKVTNSPAYNFISIDLTNDLTVGVKYKVTFKQTEGKNGSISVDEATDKAFSNRTAISVSSFTVVSGRYYRLKIYGNCNNTTLTETYTNTYTNVTLLPENASSAKISVGKSLSAYGKGNVIANVWERYTDAFVSPSAEGTLSIQFEPLGVPILITDIKLEFGNKATDWTPAPEDVDEDINNAQTSADKANNAANDAQNSADNAQSAANDANNKADHAQSSADEAAEAAQKAKEQADAAQKASEEANLLANNAWQGIDNLSQIVVVDSTGVKVKEAKNSQNYAQIRSDGMHVFTNDAEVAKFGVNSHINNLAVSDYMMFGAHRAELLTVNNEQGTAFYWIGDVQ